MLEEEILKILLELPSPGHQDISVMVKTRFKNDDKIYPQLTLALKELVEVRKYIDVSWGETKPAFQCFEHDHVKDNANQIAIWLTLSGREYSTTLVRNEKQDALNESQKSLNNQLWLHNWGILLLSIVIAVASAIQTCYTKRTYDLQKTNSDKTKCQQLSQPPTQKHPKKENTGRTLGPILPFITP